MMINGDGPIPGENYTSDTKNYPWHQPPEHSSLVSALDKMSIKLTEPKVYKSLLAFAEAGFPLVRIAQMIIMEGVSQGKWTIDMALLLAGPITKIIEIMCDSYDIEYNLGLDEDDSFNTGKFFKEVTNMKTQSNKSGLYETVSEQMPEITEAATEQEAAPEGGAPAEEEDLGMQGFAQMSAAPPKTDKESK